MAVTQTDGLVGVVTPKGNGLQTDPKFKLEFSNALAHALQEEQTSLGSSFDDGHRLIQRMYSSS